MREIFYNVILGVLFALCAVSLFITVRWLIYVLKEKEKAFIGSFQTLISSIIFVAVFSLMFFLEDNTRWVYGLTALFELIALPPSCFNILTPKGICKGLSLKSKYFPVSELSYEYSGKNVEMYFKDKPKPTVYSLLTQNTNTVKMLADWYSKHDYKNPIIPDETENKGEEE